MGEEGGGGSDEKPRRGVLYLYRPAPSAARAFCCFLLLLILLAGITALVLYLVYRPSKPHFTVVGAAVNELKATSPSAAAAVYEPGGISPVAAAAVLASTAVSTSMQFTVDIRNPSGRSSILYDRLAAYVMYRGQAITPTSPLPPLYQDEDSTVGVSLVLGGEMVPVSAEVASGLATDQAYGIVTLRLVLLGRLKYRAGPFRSAWNGFVVRCDLLVGVKKGKYGQVPLLGAAECSVDT